MKLQKEEKESSSHKLWSRSKSHRAFPTGFNSLQFVQYSNILVMKLTMSIRMGADTFSQHCKPWYIDPLWTKPSTEHHWYSLKSVWRQRMWNLDPKTSMKQASSERMDIYCCLKALWCSLGPCQCFDKGMTAIQYMWLLTESPRSPA